MTELPGIPGRALSDQAVAELARELLDAGQLGEARDVLNRHLRRVAACEAGRMELLFADWEARGRPGGAFWEWSHGRRTAGEAAGETRVRPRWPHEEFS